MLNILQIEYMGTLDKKELDVAKHIIYNGLQRAAKQMSFFIKEEVEVIQVDFNEVENPIQATLASFSDDDELLYLLTTNIVGDLGGCCFLVLTEAQANNIRNRALPPALMDNPDFYNEMKDAILLEVDNIIAASVITEFANTLHGNIHGSVPTMQHVAKNETERLIAERGNKNTHIIEFYAKFSNAAIDFKPLFIWYLDQVFIDNIKIYSAAQL